MEKRYRPDGETLRQFLLHDGFFAGLQGPFGSGKSTACVIRCGMLMAGQAPWQGKRRTKGLVVRNTYAELRTTTLETWKQWFPEDRYGPIRMHPPPFLQQIRVGDIECDVYFLALDRDEDVAKLLSFELSWAWINECREVPHRVFSDITGRVDRFPPEIEGGCTRPMVIADTNPPDEFHWFSQMSGQVPLPEHLSAAERKLLEPGEGWKFFIQPPAVLEHRTEGSGTVTYTVNPDRENAKWTKDRYYQNMLAGKTEEWVRVHLMNRVGSVFNGDTVHRGFVRHWHVRSGLEPAPDIPLLIGMDFGLTPAVVFCQEMFGRLVVYREICALDSGVVRMVPIIRRVKNELFPTNPMRGWGDPSGMNRVGTDEQTPFLILRKEGINLLPAPTNDFQVRVEAVDSLLSRSVDGLPALLIDESCRTLIRGLESGYHRRKVSGRLMEQPEKNRFSHVCEALQYVVMGAGFGRAVIGGGLSTPIEVPMRRNPFERRSNRPGERRNRI